ncbi:MAG: pyrimidine operon attenuation protein / uracil phosphoribosyltransferase [Chthoniobacter sp.]|jgi:pyrimidine operon attenuation protein/uracil phosphoribosyltransferase|nr:pyrimidine operon attenuation protein / uracil phosphoribosyltransferase [Chthoniobacter sp.]
MNPPTSSSPAPEPAVPAGAALILDAAAIERALKRIAHEIIERNPDLSRVALIGIPSRGVEVAARLAAYLSAFAGTQPFFGVIDVSMHRDDLRTRRGLWPIQPTQLPDDLSETTIVLTDDVLFSGRTCRAAMDSISSFGRPARIQYAVLIDRGHRELPIRADYVGKNLPTGQGERVFVRFEAVDGIADSVWLDRGATP